MAFIRVKMIRGKEYAYLVKSQWDPQRQTSRQVVVKYLGSPDQVSLEDIPKENLNDTIKAFVLRNSVRAADRRSKTVLQMKDKLVKTLLAGDVKSAASVSQEARDTLGLDSFYVHVVTPAMHEVGELWRSGKISISVEHLASNIMAQIVDKMNAEIQWKRGWYGTAAICTPQGEEHTLSAKVLEGLLTNRGYKPWNISASAPTDSVLGFLENRKPDLILVSLTIPQFLPSATRLVKAVRDSLPRARIVVGGQGIRQEAQKALPGGVEVAVGDTLAALDGLK